MVEAGGGATGDPGHALCDKARALFVAGEDVADGAAVQRVVERQDRAAGNSRKSADALPFEQDAEEVGSSCFHGGLGGARSRAASVEAKKKPLRCDTGGAKSFI